MLKKLTPRGVLGLGKLCLRKYWFLIVWLTACTFLFRTDYLHFKKGPQFYYLRKILGYGVCISRGTAAILNVGIFVLVLPMGRSFISCIRSVFPLWFNLLLDSFFPCCKTMHLIVAITILLASVAHSVSHFVNAFNFSRNFVASLPEVNVATYKGESPALLIFTSVPGLTGVLMLLLLAVVSLTSLRCVRTRRFEVFYYTHHCCLLFFLLMLIHPLSGALKGVINVETHPPGCRYRKVGPPSGAGFVVYKNISIQSKMPKSLNKGERTYPSPHLIAESDDTPEEMYYKRSKEIFGFAKKMGKVIGYSESFDEVFGYPEPSDDALDNSKSSDEIFGYPEPSEEIFGYPEPSEEIFGYPEPSEEIFGYPEPLDEVFEYPEESNKLFKYKELDEVIGYPEPSDEYIQLSNSEDKYLESSSELNKAETEYVEPSDKFESTETKRSNTNNDKSNTFNNYCLKPPLFVSIESKTWFWILLTGIYLLINYIIKQWRGQKEVEVLRVREFPADVLEITLRKQGFYCNPGQFILLRCPKIAPYQWHPFTVAMCPMDESGHFTILIRTKGNWCKKLRDEILKSISHSNQSKQTLFNHLGYENRSSTAINCTSCLCCSLGSYMQPIKSKKKHSDRKFQSRPNDPFQRCHRSLKETNECFNTLPSIVKYENEKNPCRPNKSVNPKYNTLSTSLYSDKASRLPHKKGSVENDQSSLSDLSTSKWGWKTYHRSRLKRSCKPELHIHSRVKSTVGEKKIIKAKVRNSDDKFKPNRRTRHLKREADIYNYSTHSTSHHAALWNHNSNFQVISPHGLYPPSSNSSDRSFPYHLANDKDLFHHYSGPHGSSNHKFNGVNLIAQRASYPSSAGPLLYRYNCNESKYYPKRKKENLRYENYSSYVIDTETPKSCSAGLFFDGPFNSPNEAILSYPVVIGVAGGIGVTPLLASLNYLLNSDQPNPRRLHIVWVLRELQLFVPLAPFFQSLIESFWVRNQVDRLELRFHCTTALNDPDSITFFQNKYPFLEARLYQGRPKWEELFDIWKQNYKSSEVGVFCCGPKSLNKQISRYSMQAVGQGLNFNYHHESFS